MNFARVICDRRGTQGIMRNMPFALQVRNQHVRIRGSFVRYRRTVTQKFLRRLRLIDRATEQVRQSRSARIDPRKIKIDAPPSTRCSTPQPSNIVRSSKQHEAHPASEFDVVTSARAALGDASLSIAMVAIRLDGLASPSPFAGT